jgi:tetrahydromethanopterin S-methyltransferase subunit G
MFLCVHAAVGALAGNAVQTPETAFLAGFVSHFFLDMIPHGDEAMLEGYKSGSAKRRALFYVTVDAVASVALIAVFFWRQDFFHPGFVAMGIVGGILPDFLVGVAEISKPSGRRWIGRQLHRFQRFHVSNHHFLIGRLRQGRDIKLRYGLVIQLASLALLVKVIL